MHSIEIWQGDQLVGGELGYVVGSIYTSLTGAKTVDSAGSVQLSALGSLLINCGFKIWDLGMQMTYKTNLGGHSIPRKEWLNEVVNCRDQITKLVCEKITASQVFPPSKLNPPPCSSDVEPRKKEKKKKNKTPFKRENGEEKIQVEKSNQNKIEHNKQQRKTKNQNNNKDKQNDNNN